MKGWTQIALFTGLTALDQAVKLLSYERICPLIPGVVRIRYTANPGFSLGLFQNGNLPALALSAVILAVLLVYRRRLPEGSPYRLPLLVMCAGAAGNLIDRIFLGYVRDMFELLFMDFYVFNVADVYVVCSAIVCAAMLLFRKEDCA